MLGDLTAAEVARARARGGRRGALLGALERERRAVRVRVGGRGAPHRRRRRRPLPRRARRRAPGGLPDAFLGGRAGCAARARCAATRAAHGPFTTEQPRARCGVGPRSSSALRELERAGDAGARRAASRLAPRRGAGEREWCDVEVLRRLRRASLAALRREIEPAERRAYASFLPAWHGIDRHRAAGAGVDRLREQLVPLQGLALTPRTWEREVLPRRVGAYSTTWMDELCASGELVWVGAGALGRNDGRVALYFREDVALLGPPTRRGEAPQRRGGHAGDLRYTRAYARV